MPLRGTFQRDRLRRSLAGAEGAVDKTLEIVKDWST